VASPDPVRDRLMEIRVGLARFPERGSYPGRRAARGDETYRQRRFKPYRIIERSLGSRVLIYLIADGRDDMQSVPARRLPGA